jgi:UPF0755 protein
MDNMIRTPRTTSDAERPTPQPITPLPSPQVPTPAQVPVTPQPIEPQSTGLGPRPSAPKRKKRVLLWIVGIVVGIIGALIIAALVWYGQQLQPVNSRDESRQPVTIAAGTTPDAIAEQLKEEGLIRDTFAFALYTRFQGVQNSLQAGSYRLSPSESLPEIVEHLTNGTVDTFTITIIPGSTLEDIRAVFKNAGYSDEEITAAYAASYESPIFSGRNNGADLEGLIFPDTYQASSGAGVQAIIQQTFDHFERIVNDNDLLAGFERQGLTLFEGITMASIIQKEAVGGDEKQIAQVFLKRYNDGMMLGSDPTYQYIADKLGQPRDLNFNSPYNTRRFVGLPPGPIANMSLTSLEAVAEPAPGDYVYFLSGDDDVTYFSRTFEEHEANIRAHCQIKCQAL